MVGSRRGIRWADDDASDLVDGLVGHAGMLVALHLAPAGPCLEPEDGGRHRFLALARRLAEQVLGNARIGLGMAVVEFGAVVLAQRLGVAADDACDLRSGMP